MGTTGYSRYYCTVPISKEPQRSLAVSIGEVEGVEVGGKDGLLLLFRGGGGAEEEEESVMSNNKV